MNDEINILPHMSRGGFRKKINHQLMKQQINLYDPHNSRNKNTAVFHRIKSHLQCKHNVTYVIDEFELKFIQNKSDNLLNTCISIFIL